MRKLTFLACLIFAFSVPVQAQDVATIQRLADQFAEAYNKSGAEGVGAMYTDDAIVVPPEADIRTGRRDIQAFWTQQARQGENLEIVVLDVKPLGADTARALVRSELTMKGPQPQPLSGRNVVILQRIGADWKVSTHTWNYSRGSSQGRQELGRGSSDPRLGRERDRDDHRRLYSDRETWRADPDRRRSWDRQYPRNYDGSQRRSWDGWDD